LQEAVVRGSTDQKPADVGRVLQELLDQLLLDILPGLAALAPASEQCSASLCGLCGFAASACTPRETITVFLEVMDQLLPVAR